MARGTPMTSSGLRSRDGCFGWVAKPRIDRGAGFSLDLVRDFEQGRLCNERVTNPGPGFHSASCRHSD